MTSVDLDAQGITQVHVILELSDWSGRLLTDDEVPTSIDISKAVEKKLEIIGWTGEHQPFWIFATVDTLVMGIKEPED